jgi:hypothetical protein
MSPTLYAKIAEGLGAVGIVVKQPAPAGTLPSRYSSAR